MAEVIWPEPALADLDAIADCIALDKLDAASALVKRLFEHVEHLQSYPEGGSRTPELKRSRYRHDGERVCIPCVMRSEQLLRPSRISGREKSQFPAPKKRPR